jgi:hypothetical protein
MGLPNARKADVSVGKIVGYLLSQTHRAGRSKASFFRKHGFSAEHWHALADALRQHAVGGHVTAVVRTAYGTRYVVDGVLKAPDGTSLNVRSVWFISENDSVPRFATAYPLKRKVGDQRT